MKKMRIVRARESKKLQCVVIRHQKDDKKSKFKIFLSFLSMFLMRSMRCRMIVLLMLLSVSVVNLYAPIYDISKSTSNQREDAIEIVNISISHSSHASEDKALFNSTKKELVAQKSIKKEVSTYGTENSSKKSHKDEADSTQTSTYGFKYSSQISHPQGEHSCKLKTIMCKFDSNCPVKGMKIAPLLVTGVGASGTLATVRKLSAAGLKVTGEDEEGRDANIAWTFRCDGTPEAREYLSLGQRVRGWRLMRQLFLKVAHLVRHPLAVLSSYQHFSANMETKLNKKVWGYIETFTELRGLFREKNGSWKHPVVRSAIHWLTWNEQVEKVSDVRFRVEDSSTPISICKLAVNATIGLNPNEDRSFDCSRTFQNVDAHSHTSGPRKHEKVTWDTLKALDPELEERVWTKAQQYGYSRKVPKRIKDEKALTVERSRADLQKRKLRNMRSRIKLSEQGALVTTQPSSNSPGYFPERAFDGDDQTYFWSMDSGEGMAGDYLQISFEVPRIIKTIRVLHCLPGRTGGDCIEDGIVKIAQRNCSEALEENFTSVMKVVSSEKDCRVTGIDFSGVQCMRLELLSNQAKWIAVREVRLS